MKSDCRDEGQELCPVGLEKALISREYVMRRAEAKRLVLLSVLEAQADFTPEGIDGRHVKIALASMKESRWSRSQAQLLGAAQAKYDM